MPSTDAVAWGDEGHRIVAAIAYARLTPAVRAKTNKLLAGDKDKLTAADFVSRSTWADRYRDSDRFGAQTHYIGTRAWHFADIEIDDGSLDKACHNPHPPPGVPASKGPADDCVVGKIDQFVAELRDPRTTVAEKRLALKFVIHFVGDLHQPLHVADHHDRGGNSVPVLYGRHTSPDNLHAYWDKQLVQKLGLDAGKVAAALSKKITIAHAHEWSAGSPHEWAQDTFAKARDVAYDFSGETSFTDKQGVQGQRLDATYDARATPVASEQLSKAGVRLAAILNDALK